MLGRNPSVGDVAPEAMELRLRHCTRYMADASDADVSGESYETIAAELDDRGLLEIVLDRPDQHNALNEQLRSELDALLGAVPTEDVRCVTIEGAAESAFSAGADVGEFESMDPIEGMDVTPVYETLRHFPRPTIAKIEGYCLGGGHELALACDLRIATEDAMFGFPEIGLGVFPGGGGTIRLLRLLGEAKAKELIFRGNEIDGTTADDLGLVNHAVPADEFDAVVEAFVSDIVSGPPVGLAIVKKVLNEGQDASLEAALAMESQGFGLLLGTDDTAEGIAAFNENREPTFEGR